MNISFVYSKTEANNIISFFFRPERPLRYVAGQFIELTIPHSNPDDRGIKHWFTLSSSPNHELISITTKFADKSSSFKKEFRNLKSGKSLEISEPMGDFVLPKDESIPLVFIAGGIGITPFHSIVQWLIDTESKRTIQLLYSAHSSEEIIFKDIFKQPYIELHIIVDGTNLTAKKIIEIVGDIAHKQLFISGPEPMTETIVAQFKKIGINQNKLITDYFPGYSA